MDKPGLQTLSKSLLLLTVFFAGCYYDKKELLYPPAPGCGPVNMSFSTDITPILSTNCYSCHSSQMALGSVILDTFEGAAQVAGNGKLMGAINHQAGFSPMPQGAGKLAACDIEKIGKWIEEGTKNN